jgi:hypothetical protein
MSKDVEMKQHVLEMLKNFMLGEQGKKIKPKAISVEMIAAKPKSKEGLEDVLNDASKEPTKDEVSDMDGDEKRSMKDYFKRK